MTDASTTARGDRRTELIAAARHLLETEGAEAITIRRLGAVVGIRGPSVYKHVPDKAAVEDELVLICLTEQAEALQDVPLTFAALASAYRKWALTHPHMHRLLNDRPLNRSKLPAGLEDRAAAPLVAACDNDRALARAAWATIKGLVDLELADRFPPDTDLNAVYAAAVRAYASAGQPPERGDLRAKNSPPGTGGVPWGDRSKGRRG